MMFTLVVTVLFLILAVAIEEWHCGGLLTETCRRAFQDNPNRAVIALLSTALILWIFVFVLDIIDWQIEQSWIGILNIVISTCAAILAIAGILLYYNRNTKRWSELLGAIGMTSGCAATINLVVNLLSKKAT